MAWVSGTWTRRGSGRSASSFTSSRWAESDAHLTWALAVRSSEGRDVLNGLTTSRRKRRPLETGRDRSHGRDIRAMHRHMRGVAKGFLVPVIPTSGIILAVRIFDVRSVLPLSSEGIARIGTKCWDS